MLKYRFSGCLIILDYPAAAHPCPSAYTPNASNIAATT
jgi:hypothetical protein